MGSDEEALPPDEAFRLLGAETRLAILRAVWESPEEAVAFSAIRERVGNPDSGAFNYHLNELGGHFLAPGEGGEGYRLTQAGREVVRAVMAGTITRRPGTEPVGIDARCVECGGALVARYDEYGIVECGDCGATVMWNEFPPAGLEGRTPREVATAFDRWTRSRFRLAMDGICPNCAAEMSTTILGSDSDFDSGSDRGPDSDRGSDLDSSEGAGLATEHRCENCRYEARVPLFGHVLNHPAVVSFYYEEGVHVTAMPYWAMRELARAFTEEVVSEDPWRAEVTMEADGRTLGLTLDERLDVVGVRSTGR